MILCKDCMYACHLSITNNFLTIKLKLSSNLTASTSFCKSLNHSVSIQLVFVGVTPERGLIPFTEANGVLDEIWESLGLGGSFLDNFLLWISWEGADYPGGGGGGSGTHAQWKARPSPLLSIDQASYFPPLPHFSSSFIQLRVFQRNIGQDKINLFCCHRGDKLILCW